MFKKKNMLYLLIGTAITCIVLKEFLNMHYATDTYNIINRGYINYAIQYSLNDGRVFMFLIGMFAYVLKVSINKFVISLTILAIIISNINIIVLKNIIEKYKKTKNICEDILLYLICYSVIFNFMWLENMQYVECFVMAMSVLLNLLGAKCFVENKVYKAVILITFSVFCYQATLHIFVIFVALFLIISDNYKNIFIKIFKAVLACIFVCIVNYLFIKLIGKILMIELTRVKFNIIHIMFGAIVVSLPEILLYTCNIFPTGVFIIFLTFIITFYNEKKEVILFTFLSIISCFGISIFSTSSFGAPRMLFALGALVGNLLLLLYSKTNNNKLVAVCAIIYVVVILLNYMYIIHEHKNVYVYTERECDEIKEYILTYEQTSGNKVKNIAIYNDLSPTYYYCENKNRSSLCLRPLSVEWSDEAVINYFCNTNLVEIQPETEIYNKYFYNKDWDEIDKEQFVFIGDTLHYCIY